MKITENVQMLELGGERGALYPVLISGNGELVLIDTGLPMQTDILKEAVEKEGYSLGEITHVILTHQDLDHVGSAKALSDMGAKIIAHEIEAPYIQGDKTSIRLDDMKARLDKGELSEEETAFYERSKAGAPYFYVKVDSPVKDGEIIDLCGGVKVIHTPGHTPGHMAVLHLESNTLVTGDAADITDGKLVEFDANFTRDSEQARESMEKMLDCKPSTVVCYHSGLLKLN